MAGRRAKRLRTGGKIAVGFLGAGARFGGDLVDLSTTGVLIRCSQELEPGTMGRLGINVGPSTLRPVAVVRRLVSNVGIAFEFTNMNPHDRELLHRLLMRLGKLPTS